MGGQPFKVMDSILLEDDTPEGLHAQIRELIHETEYHELYHQKGTFFKDSDTNKWKVVVEYSVIGGIYKNQETKDMSFDERTELESSIGLEILLLHGVEEAREYLDYEPRPTDEFLADLKEKGLPETAKAYGAPVEALIALQGINIRMIQEHFHYSKRRPIQIELADKLGTTRDFLEYLRQSGWA